MRLTYVTALGFRGFTDERTIRLDSDVVILVGENGRGKTTVFDAVLWCLTGQVKRIAGKSDKLLSLFSRSGEMRVEVGLSGESGPVVVSRRFDGTLETVQLQSGGRTLNNERAELELLDLMSASGDALDAGTLYETLVRSTYLQQDLVKEFISASDDHLRFLAYAELLGAGQIAEVQLALEKAKAAWAAATTRLKKETEPERIRVLELESQLAGSSLEAASVSLQVEWGQLLVIARSAGLDLRQGPNPSRTELESVLSQAQLRLRTSVDKSERTRELLAAIEAVGPSRSEELEGRRHSEMLSESARVATRVALDAASEELRVSRNAYEQARDRNDRSRLMAELALGLLDEHCPVCGQVHDVDKTRHRMEVLLESSVEETPDVHRAQESAREAAAKLDELDLQIRNSEIETRRIADYEATRTSALAAVRSRAVGVGLDGDLPLEALNQAAQALFRSEEATQRQIAAITEAAEKMSLRMSEIALAQRASLLTAELELARAEAARAQREIDVREATSEFANRATPALREAADEVVRDQVQHIEPVFQMIYSAIDPHPAFKSVRLVQARSGKTAHLSTQVVDPLSEATSSTPLDVLSSSQANSMAVSLFLALNLSANRQVIKSVLLDDPMQSMDSVHLLGLVDVLRRVAPRRQVIVATHDPAFGQLLARKLRPVEGSIASTLVVRITAWTRSGPDIEYQELPTDTQPLRMTG